jgi:thiosulfate/3-mercaptopyruvate sulfurtransferase
MSEIKDRGYSNPDVLVTTEWAANHLNDKNVRIVESNEDQLLYSTGHIPGAVHVDWTKDLNDQVRRDYLDKKGFESLMSRIGATSGTNWFFMVIKITGGHVMLTGFSSSSGIKMLK